MIDAYRDKRKLTKKMVDAFVEKIEVNADRSIKIHLVYDDMLKELVCYATLEDASAYVCSQMLKRKEIFTVKLAKLRHSTGTSANKQFILSDWQYWIVCAIYGFKRKSDGTRLTRTVYIEIGRKNGKSSLMAALALYHLVADGEQNAQVIFAANSAKQAGLCFEMSYNYCSSIDHKGKFFKRYRDTIKFPTTKSKLEVVSADANLKNEIEKKNPKTATGMTYIAKRAGSVNAETAYVLERFHAEAPAMISDVGTQIKDIQIRRTEGVNSHISMKKAWEMMKILGVVTLPVVRENKLEGLIVTGDIAKS